MDTVTLSTYITDLTNGCNYLDQMVSTSNQDQIRIKEIINGLEYQLSLPIVTESDEQLNDFHSSVTAGKAYLAGLGGDAFQAAISAVKDLHPKPTEETI